jgi:hypothetical protein
MRTRTRISLFFEISQHASSGRLQQDSTLATFPACCPPACASPPREDSFLFFVVRVGNLLRLSASNGSYFYLRHYIHIPGKAVNARSSQKLDLDLTSLHSSI